jgi:hypothetical protein
MSGMALFVTVVFEIRLGCLTGRPVFLTPSFVRDGHWLIDHVTCHGYYSRKIQVRIQLSTVCYHVTVSC